MNYGRHKQCLPFLHVKSRIHVIHIPLVQFFPQQFNSFTESLEVDDFPLPQELNDIIDIRIVA